MILIDVDFSYFPFEIFFKSFDFRGDILDAVFFRFYDYIYNHYIYI